MSAVDLVRWLGVGLSAPTAAGALSSALATRFAVRHVFMTSTGRAGLTVMLRAMRRLRPERTDVVVPGYTCYSVPASIVKAGLRPRFVDIVPETLDYTPGALAAIDHRQTLAIIATNLYGLPNDLPALERLAHEQGAFLIDDAAQAMGATVGGRWSGTWGDAGLFSFDKGKNVSAIDGGAIVTQADDLASILVEEMTGLESPGLGATGAHIAKALVYFAMLRPSLYGIPARIPQLGLGRTEFTTDFPLARPDRALSALGVTMLPHLEAFTTTRRDNAAAILGAVAGLKPLATITPLPGSTPAWLRLPLLAPDSRTRYAAIAALTAAGIGATGSYPAALGDVAPLRELVANPGAPLPGARDVAARILTLPTHPFVTAGDITRMAATLARVVGS